ncbi:twin-arginine translocation signal domain-containing protein [Streptomyces sp. NPDC101393]|uniref:twin-arginine translocation signal domain-containing protein n=1 Tax=Streptomyces sp. NPDC101393 TaxID=3366141 RepID=UPI003825ADA0
MPHPTLAPTPPHPPLPPPPSCEVPHFAPVRAGGGKPFRRRTTRRQLLAACLAMTAAALVTGVSLGGPGPARTPGCPAPAVSGGR